MKEVNYEKLKQSRTKRRKTKELTFEKAKSKVELGVAGWVSQKYNTLT